MSRAFSGRASRHTRERQLHLAVGVDRTPFRRSSIPSGFRRYRASSPAVAVLRRVASATQKSWPPGGTGRVGPRTRPAGQLEQLELEVRDLVDRGVSEVAIDQSGRTTPDEEVGHALEFPRREPPLLQSSGLLAGRRRHLLAKMRAAQYRGSSFSPQTGANWGHFKDDCWG
jgi:hypothetical protein